MLFFVILVAIGVVCSLGYAPKLIARPALLLKSSVIDDKAEVKEYFDNEGFNRLCTFACGHIYSLIDSLIYSLIDSVIHSLIYSLIDSVIDSLIDSLTH